MIQNLNISNICNNYEFAVLKKKKEKKLLKLNTLRLKVVDAVSNYEFIIR